jgi:hypothetical protein
MGKSDRKLPDWTRKFRWLWFAVAVIGIIQTPGAILSAIRLVHADHRLAFLPFVALPIRIGMICMFLWLWWIARPVKDKPQGEL